MNALEGAPYSIAASGEFDGAGGVYKVFGIILTAGADAASVSLKSGGTGGTELIPPIKAVLETTTVVMFPVSIAFGNGVFGTLTGTTPDATVIMRKV